VTHFTLLDGAIVALSLAATLWVGLYARRYVGTLEDYLVAKRGMGLYVGTASLVSTEIGIITYMYQAQFGFVAGFSAFVVGLITLAVCLFVGRTGFVVNRLRALEIMTVPEYFERRYTRGVRVFAGLVMAFGGGLNLGIFPLIEARFLAILTGIPAAYLTWTMAALLLMALAYTAVGGMVSLVVTNYLQYLLIALGTVIVTVACLRATDWSTMTRAVSAQMGGQGFDPIADLGVGFIFWQVLLWVALMTVWQTVAMRTFSTKDPATARKVFTLTSFLFLARAVLPMAWGIAALAFFGGRVSDQAASAAPEPMAVERFQADLDAGRIEDVLPGVDRLDAARREEIGLVAMPWMLARVLPSGLLGLVVAGMLAASLSTYAGYFLGWSAILSQDVVAPWLRRDLSERTRLVLTRSMIVALVAFIMVWSLFYKVPGPAFFYLQVTANLFMAPTLLAVVGGLYWPRASSAGAYLAFLLGAGASLAYLVPSLGVGVATAGNLSWGLAALGLVTGSLLRPDRPALKAAA
jgi:solute:Na+ symporter, SSS family